MVEVRTQSFSSSLSIFAEAQKDIGKQIMQAIFGITLTDDTTVYKNHMKFKIYQSSEYIFIFLYVNSSSSVYSPTIYTTQDYSGTVNATVTWIESDYMIKFGSFFIWKNRYTMSSTYSTSADLLDLETGAIYTSALKEITANNGMVAIAPLYQNGVIIEDAYMCNCSYMKTYEIYYVGGRLCMKLGNSILLALEASS